MLLNLPQNFSNWHSNFSVRAYFFFYGRCLDEGGVGTDGQNMVGCADVILSDIIESAGNLNFGTSNDAADESAVVNDQGKLLFNNI